MRVIIFLMLFFSSVALLLGCEPGGYLTIINNRSDEVEIHKYDFLTQDQLDGPYSYGTVPGKKRKMVGGIVYTLGLDQKFRIQAIKTSGETVFSKDLTAQELIDIKWTITIPPE